MIRKWGGDNIALFIIPVEKTWTLSLFSAFEKAEWLLVDIVELLTNKKAL